MKDLILDINYDLDFYDGDFIIEDSNNQEIELICLNNYGHLRQYPTFGVGINKFLNGQWSQEVKNLISKALESDGFEINSISYNGDKINIDAIK